MRDCRQDLGKAEPLRVRAHRVELEVADRVAQGGLDVGAVGLEVGGREAAAERREARHQPGAGLAAVELVGAVRRQPPQGRCERGPGRACRPRAATCPPGANTPRMPASAATRSASSARAPASERATGTPAVGQLGRHLDGGSGRQRSPPLGHRLPGRDRAGDGDRVHAPLGHRSARGRRGRSAAAAVDRVGHAVVDERHDVAADGAHVRVDDGEGTGRGQRGVDGVPAGREGRPPGLGRVGVGGGDGIAAAVGGIRHRAAPRRRW